MDSMAGSSEGSVGPLHMTVAAPNLKGRKMADIIPMKPTTAMLEAKSGVEGSPPSSTDLVMLLDADYTRLHNLLTISAKTIRSGVPHHAAKIMTTVFAELAIHVSVEETIIFPAIPKHWDTQSVGLSQTQHVLLQDLAATLDSLHPADPCYASVFKDLRNYILRHIKRERLQIFPAIRYSNLNQTSLTQQMISLQQTARRDHRLEPIFPLT